MAFRKRSTIKKYRALQKISNFLGEANCPFCDFDKKPEKVISEYKYFYVTINDFPYDIWDDQGVTDHLMIIPKRHLLSISEFNANEIAEYHKIIGDYDSKGYSLYARSNKNKSKTVAHQHTHLVKLDGTHSKFILSVCKPYILIRFKLHK